MPIEAAVNGCRLAIPPNTGVAETYPGHVYSDPVENVEEALNSAPPGREAPVSPTDPFKRLQALI